MKLVKLSDETYKQLVKRGRYGDTMDTIISRVLVAKTEKEIATQ